MTDQLTEVDMVPSEPVVVCLTSNAHHLGSGRDIAGKMHYWEFHSYLGPTFTDSRGNVLKRQPIRPSHRAWKPFEEWLTHKRMKGDIK